MNTASWESYRSSGDDLRRHNILRASTAPIAGYPSHPMSLIPGQASRATVRPDLYFTGASSRRMTIADDIRNAHNIPPPLPPVPLYPVHEEFQPRPAPPVPSSTPPPPRPPLPPSLTAASFRVSASPPPIPPKPFTVPFSQHEDARPKLSVSILPRSLIPGDQSTQDTESAEPPVESEIAMAIALSASVSDEEAIHRQKLALQEEEDIAKALEASMSETSNSGHSQFFDNVYASSSSNDQSSATSQSVSTSHDHEASQDEVLARMSTIPSETSNTDSESVPSQSVNSSDHEPSTPTLVSEQKSTTAAPPIQELVSLTNPELPVVYSPGAVDGSSSTVSAKHNAHLELEASLPSPSTPSVLTYLCPTPQVDKTFEAHILTDDATPLSQSPEPITNTLPPTSVASSPGNQIQERQEFSSSNAINRSPPISAKFREAYPSSAPNTPNLPESSPRGEPSRNPSFGSSTKKSTPVLKHSDSTSARESSAVSGSDSSPDPHLEPLPPSYTETPLLVTEDITQQNTTDPSSASPRSTAQFSPYIPFSRPPSLISTSSSVQRHSSSTASQVDVKCGSPIDHLSRNSSTTSSTDGSVSGIHPARPRANSAINLNAFVNKELFVGVSVGFMEPSISSQLVPMAEEMNPCISLPYGKSRPFHLQGPSWRHLLKLMASLSGTRMEAALDAIATMKTPPKLRTVVQFIKPHPGSSVWRTVFYFTIDYLPPQPSIRHRSVDDLPYSYTLSGIPTLLRDAANSLHSKTYTIPASNLVPYPILPITFPSLALYMQAALEESRRYLNDSHSDYRKLAKMITTCYPDEDVTPGPPERRGLFKRVMGLSSKPQKRGGNEDTYELVTPFVPDEWG